MGPRFRVVLPQVAVVQCIELIWGIIMIDFHTRIRHNIVAASVSDKLHWVNVDSLSKENNFYVTETDAGNLDVWLRENCSFKHTQIEV